MNNERVVTIIAGEGGHLAQAKRFMNLDCNSFHNVKYILISDANVNIPGIGLHLERNISKFTKVRSFMNLFMFFIYYVRLFFSSFVYVLSKKPEILISFGPILAIPYLFRGRLFRIEVIHVETWSRFYSRSFTGRIAYYLATKFIVQNKELQKLYPKSIYGGRL
jgi:UDP-N-acetylglucosamine:LPS N-acetylglucosamine transferase